MNFKRTDINDATRVYTYENGYTAIEYDNGIDRAQFQFASVEKFNEFVKALQEHGKP